MWSTLLWSICSLFILTPLNVSSVNQNISLLYKTLFGGDYTPTLHPHCSEHAMNVTIDVGLREIVELSEKNEAIKLKIWVRLIWNDCNFVWNASEFGGISEIGVPYDKLWIPDVTLFEDIDDIANMPDMKQYRALITNAGEIQYHFPTTVHMTCGMNISMFPYDHQLCTMTFGSWIHSNKYIEMFSKSDCGDLTSFVSHQEWIVVSLKATKRINTYISRKDPFSSVSYKLEIKRKATFYIITMILPFFALTILSIAGFFLPSISGEKITFHMNILLAVTVFLLVIQDTLPSSSEFFPKIGIYFLITLLLTCLSCVMSAIVLYLFYHDFSGKQVPEWASLILIEKLGRLMCMKQHYLNPAQSHENSLKERSEEMAERSSVIPTNKSKKNRKSIKSLYSQAFENSVYDNWEKGEVQGQDQKRTSFRETDKSASSEARKKMNEWEMLAYTLDRFFTVFYVFVTTINTIAFLIVLSENDY